jgi:hypothetical protein
MVAGVVIKKIHNNLEKGGKLLIHSGCGREKILIHDIYSGPPGKKRG